MNILELLEKTLNLLLRRDEKDFIYVALGDSTVEGIGASSSEKTVPSIIHKSLLEKYKNAKVYNLGTGGAKTKDVIKKQLNKAIQLDPNLITISIGANDVMYGKTLFKFKKELKFLLEQLRSKTKAQIAINNIPNFSGALGVPQPIRWLHSFRAKKFNIAIQKICKELDIIYVDIYSTTKLLSNYQEFISKDRLHPSDIGYAIWAYLIISNLEKNFAFQSAL